MKKAKDILKSARAEILSNIRKMMAVYAVYQKKSGNEIRIKSKELAPNGISIYVLDFDHEDNIGDDITEVCVVIDELIFNLIDGSLVATIEDWDNEDITKTSFDNLECIATCLEEKLSAKKEIKVGDWFKYISTGEVVRVEGIEERTTDYGDTEEVILVRDTDGHGFGAYRADLEDPTMVIRL